ncbi:hypothetical protein [Streptomyces wuyuanensis]|uniref:Peptide/nickel transport system permease protein n=1 Tax=Streptomyces wuyuanensis TaxID=1196353 RepID=A0A1G9TR81_9ACTN|nr:peptide/nickel transport system permease protein [Streptomyces wuyuanensis]
MAASAAIATGAALAALVVPPLARLDGQAVDASTKLRPPSRERLPGTGDVGRDLLPRCVHGLPISLLVGLVAALAATVAGAAFGAAVVAFGRRRDGAVLPGPTPVTGLPPGTTPLSSR